MTGLRRAAIAAWALLGLLLGHTMAYAATFRDSQVLVHVLEDTGHNWLSLLPVLVAFAIAVLVITSSRGATGAGSLRRRYLALAALQVSAYIAVEVIERIAHGSSAGEVFSTLSSGYGPTLIAFGVAAQLLVAAAATLLSRVVERAVARLRAARSLRMARVSNPKRITTRPAKLRTLFGGLSQGVRAPPLS